MGAANHRSSPSRLSRCRAASSHASNVSAFLNSSSQSSTGFLLLYQLRSFCTCVRAIVAHHVPAEDGKGREGKGRDLVTFCQKVATSTRTLQMATATPNIAEDGHKQHRLTPVRSGSVGRSGSW